MLYYYSFIAFDALRETYISAIKFLPLSDIAIMSRWNLAISVVLYNNVVKHEKLERDGGSLILLSM